MELTLVNPCAHVGCRVVWSTVTVSAWDGKVVLVRRDGNHAPVVCRERAADPDLRVRQVVRDLTAEGYELAG